MISTVVDNKASLPVLRCVRIVSGAATLRLEATDLDRTVIVQIGPDDPAPAFDAAVEWTKIKEAIGRDSISIDINTSGKKWSGTISSVKGKVSYQTEILAFPIKEWPMFESAIHGSDTGWHPLDASFTADYTSMRPICSDDPTRYVITGVLYDAVAKTLVSTNGRALTTVTNDRLPEFPATTSRQLILPDHGFLSCDLIRDRDAEIRFGTRFDYDAKGPKSKEYLEPASRFPDNLEYKVEIGAVKIFFWTRLIDGFYPNWRQVMPQHQHPVVIRLEDPAEAYKLLRSFKLKAADTVKISTYSRSVKFETSGGSFEVEATGGGVRFINIAVRYLDYLLADGYQVFQIEDERTPLLASRSDHQLVIMPCTTQEMKQAEEARAAAALAADKAA
jgi:hypothetical protein